MPCSLTANSLWRADLSALRRVDGSVVRAGWRFCLTCSYVLEAIFVSFWGWNSSAENVPHGLWCLGRGSRLGSGNAQDADAINRQFWLQKGGENATRLNVTAD